MDCSSSEQFVSKDGAVVRSSKRSFGLREAHEDVWCCTVQNLYLSAVTLVPKQRVSDCPPRNGGVKPQNVAGAPASLQYEHIYASFPTSLSPCAQRASFAAAAAAAAATFVYFLLFLSV